MNYVRLEMGILHLGSFILEENGESMPKAIC
jgi:hypothetical protein